MERAQPGWVRRTRTNGRPPDYLKNFEHFSDGRTVIPSVIGANPRPPGVRTVIDLGTQPGVPTLPAVTLSLDEMDYLVDTLALDVLPVVLDATPRYDTYDARDAAFRGAVDTLAARDLLPGGGVHPPELADRLRVLARPLWEIALRWYVDGSISRLCISQAMPSRCWPCAPTTRTSSRMRAPTSSPPP